MLILKSSISREELRALAENTFGYMIKGVADISRGVMALDADLHSDLERLLIVDGSNQSDLWGFNLYPDETGDAFIEYDSLINIRSWQGNPSRDILDPGVRGALKEVIEKFIKD